MAAIGGLALLAQVGCEGPRPPAPWVDFDGAVTGDMGLDQAPADNGTLDVAAQIDTSLDSPAVVDSSAAVDTRPLADAWWHPDDSSSPTLVGQLSVLTYNVAGLPQGVSDEHPARNIPQISPLLNPYPLVLVQEDFWYHDELAARTGHPYPSRPMVNSPTLLNLGDGLNRFSMYAFRAFDRVKWRACSGYYDDKNDCLTPKGFSVARTTLGLGAEVYVYNIHTDAGSSRSDIGARAKQAEQLIVDIATRAHGKAVIVAGDTNLKPSRPEDMVILDALLTRAGLADACRTLACGEERVDRVLFRGSDLLAIEPLSWDTPDEFVDSAQAPLSDHEPVLVHFRWERGSARR